MKKEMNWKDELPQEICDFFNCKTSRDFKIVYKRTCISKIRRNVLQLCTLMYPQKQIGMRYYMCQTDRHT